MRRVLASTLGLLVMATLSCGDNDEGPTEPDGPAGPATGSIHVSLTMSGGDTDPDGCTVTVDGESVQQLNAGATIAFAHLSAGTHEIEIDGVAANCLVDGDLQRSVTVVAGETRRETFTAACDWRTRIAFESSRDGNSEIYVMNPDGTAQVRLTNHPAPDGEPSWSPDGTRIAFVRNFGGGWGGYEIYVMNPDGTEQVRLTDNSVYDGCPTWLPDGRIAFESTREGGGIYVMNADGTDPVFLGNFFGGCPRWSPDGTRVVLTRGHGREGSEIFVMNPDGSGQVNLTDDPYGRDYHPSWSPDGTRIAYVTDFHTGELGQEEVMVMNADGSGKVNLANNPGQDEFPTWSPDGSRIAFYSWRGYEERGIYVMNADGSVPVGLSSDPNGGDRNPRWSPDLY